MKTRSRAVRQDEKKMILAERAIEEVKMAFHSVVDDFLEPGKQQANVVGMGMGIKPAIDGYSAGHYKITACRDLRLRSPSRRHHQPTCSRDRCFFKVLHTEQQPCSGKCQQCIAG